MSALRSACVRPAHVTLGLALLLGGCRSPAAEWLDESVPEPIMFAPGAVSTPEREYGVTFTPDGREAYFTRRGRRGPPSIWVSRWVDGAWTEAAPAPFSLEGDEAPFITPDGSRMLFASRRPMRGTRDDSENLWVMDRAADGWSEPAPVPGTVNQPGGEVDDFDVGSELGPVLIPDGSLLYWTRVDAEWGSDLFVARFGGADGWVEPRPLSINSYGDESSPAMSPDGRYLVFQGYRGTDGVGDQDLYLSERTDYGWSDPRPLPEPINSARADGYPSFSADGRFFFFASDRDDRGGYYDIYYVDVEALGPPGRER